MTASKNGDRPENVDDLIRERDEAKEKLLEALEENRKLRRKVKTRARLAAFAIRQRRSRAV